MRRYDIFISIYLSIYLICLRYLEVIALGEEDDEEEEDEEGEDETDKLTHDARLLGPLNSLCTYTKTSLIFTFSLFLLFFLISLFSSLFLFVVFRFFLLFLLSSWKALKSFPQGEGRGMGDTWLYTLFIPDFMFLDFCIHIFIYQWSWIQRFFRRHVESAEKGQETEESP